MSAREFDPAAWAAAYGAAFASLNTTYDVKHAVDDEAPRSIADAAVLALHPEMRSSTPESTGARDAAWARLLKAECDIVDCQRGEIAGARDEQRDARQALRDLGVDVDALLGEP